MGWDFTVGANRKDIIQECIKSGAWTDAKGQELETEMVQHRAIAGTLWGIQKLSNHTNGEVKLAIVCILLKKETCRGQESWGYCWMSEAGGPFYYNVPLKYLDLVPVANQEWRDEVMRHQKFTQFRKGLITTLQTGDEVELSGCVPSEFIVTDVKPKGKTIKIVGRGKSDGRAYALPLNRIVAYKIVR